MKPGICQMRVILATLNAKVHIQMQFRIGFMRLYLIGRKITLEKSDLSLSELFSEEPTAFTGIFKISATRLVRRGEK